MTTPSKSTAGELIDFAANSKHILPHAWALGIDTAGKSFGDVQALSTRSMPDDLRAQSQLTRAKIDTKISDILKSHNIVLSKNETLNVKVNQKGEIVVGEDGGIFGDRRANIEKLLNEDQTLAQDLLYSHAEYQMANWMVKPQSDARDYILADIILRREYGVSLNNFQINDAGNGIQAKNGDNTVLDRIASEEMLFHSFMFSALQGLEKNEGDYEVSFSYKNGVTIEKGATDQIALSETSKNLLSKAFEWQAKASGADYTVTLNPNGTVLNAQVTTIRDKNLFFSDAAKWTHSLQNYLQNAAGDTADLNSFWSSPSRFKQYVFDSQRLFQFNTGVDAATGKSMSVTFGHSYK